MLLHVLSPESRRSGFYIEKNCVPIWGPSAETKHKCAKYLADLIWLDCLCAKDNRITKLLSKVSF